MNDPVPFWMYLCGMILVAVHNSVMGFVLGLRAGRLNRDETATRGE